MNAPVAVDPIAAIGPDWKPVCSYDSDEGTRTDLDRLFIDVAVRIEQTFGSPRTVIGYVIDVTAESVRVYLGPNRTATYSRRSVVAWRPANPQNRLELGPNT